jgi:hypothetical protein
VKEDFEYELVILRMHTMTKVQVVLAPSLSFASTYNTTKVHNTLTLMFNSCFKFLDVVKTFVGWAKVIQMVAEYDNKILLPLLVIAFQFLNPSIHGLIEVAPVDDDYNFIL